MGQRRRVRAGDAIADYYQLAAPQRLARPVGVRQAHDGIGGHDPDGLDLARVDRLEQLDCFQSGLPRHGRTAPKVPHDAAVRSGLEAHVRREHVSHAADFPAAHGIRLSGQ